MGGCVMKATRTYHEEKCDPGIQLTAFAGRDVQVTQQAVPLVELTLVRHHVHEAATDPVLEQVIQFTYFLTSTARRRVAQALWQARQRGSEQNVVIDGHEPTRTPAHASSHASLANS